MNKKILRPILIMVSLSSPLLALLTITPIYIINLGNTLPFFNIWVQVLLGVLFSWALQISIYLGFKKKGFSNISYGIFLFFFMLVFLFFTNLSISKFILFESYSQSNAFILRFSLSFSIQLIIFLILDLVYSKEEKVHLVKENAALIYNNLETEYNLLKSQINPHFLFNALNISKSLIRTQPKIAEKYIIQLSEFLRRSLNDEQKAIPLHQELAHCKQYIDLQKMRVENAIHYKVNIDNRHLHKKLPFFSLITLAENAIKHNALSEENPLTISVEIVDDFLVVKNNIKVKKGVISTNIGLNSLNQRSKMVSNTEIEIENDGQHFCVKVKLIKP